MRFFARAFLLVGLIATAILFHESVQAQSSDSDHNATSTAESSPTKAAPEPESEEDPTAQFKHSASVRLLSRITGLSTDNAYWLAVVLNFAIVVGAIWWFSKKNLPAMFRNRTASIQKFLEEARTASEDANKRLSEIESRLSRLDQGHARDIGKGSCSRRGTNQGCHSRGIAQNRRIRATGNCGCYESCAPRVDGVRRGLGSHAGKQTNEG